MSVALALAVAWEGVTAGGCDAPSDRTSDAALEDAPNVVLIVVDTLRRDRLGSAGNPRPATPRLDRLARSSVEFANAVAPSSWTTPSMAALMTSRYPTALGIRGVKAVLPDDVVTMAEVLQDHGYTTAAVVSNGFCGSEWNLDQGFELFEESFVQRHSNATSAAVTDSALVMLDRIRTTEPFLLWVHYFDPHMIYLRHDPWDFGRDVPYEGPVGDTLARRQVQSQRRNFLADDIREMFDLYDSEVAYTDDQIGRLLRGLEARGHATDTMILMTADHGEEFREHGEFGHGRSLYDEVLAVPLLVRFPARSRPFPFGLRDDPATLLDVYPTVVRAAGFDVPDDTEGRDLSPIATGGRTESVLVFGETERFQSVRCVRLGDRKAVFFPRRGERETYDLAADPGEQRNLYRGVRENDDPLHRALAEWAKRLEASAADPTVIEFDAETMERLEALGYVGD